VPAARHRGYRHVAAAGAYVAHLSQVSFKGAGRALNLRNGRVLVRLHPGFETLIGAHVKADPLAPARRRLMNPVYGRQVQKRRAADLASSRRRRCAAGWG